MSSWDPFRKLALEWNHFAAVSSGCILSEPELHSVVHAQHEGVRTLFFELQQRGCRRIGYTGQSISEDRHRDLRLGAALASMSRTGQESLWFLWNRERKTFAPPPCTMIRKFPKSPASPKILRKRGGWRSIWSQGGSSGVSRGFRRTRTKHKFTAPVSNPTSPHITTGDGVSFWRGDGRFPDPK